MVPDQQGQQTPSNFAEGGSHAKNVASAVMSRCTIQIGNHLYLKALTQGSQRHRRIVHTGTVCVAAYLLVALCFAIHWSSFLISLVWSEITFLAIACICGSLPFLSWAFAISIPA